jgi:hypothetical protein
VSTKKGFLSRLSRSQTDLDADRLQTEAEDKGATLVKDCTGGCVSTVQGRLRSVTLRPVGKAPAVEAELWDGSGRLTLLFLGRRRIAGITPGRSIVVHGRAILRDGSAVMVNPRYELLPPSAE